VVVDDVATLGPGAESPILLLSNLSPLLSVPLIGSLFAPYGRLRVNLLLSVRHQLAALLRFESVQCARNAYQALNGMQVQIDVQRPLPAHMQSPGAPLQHASDPPVFLPLQLSFVAYHANGAPDVRMAPQVSIRAVTQPEAYAPGHAYAAAQPGHASAPGGMAV